jgi:hypothetical protein
MSAGKTRSAGSIESRLPGETPALQERRVVTVSVSSDAFSDWSEADKEQLSGILHVFGENLRLLAGLPEEVREDALRQIGFQTGPTMTQLLKHTERLAERFEQAKEESEFEPGTPGQPGSA